MTPTVLDIPFLKHLDKEKSIGNVLISELIEKGINDPHCLFHFSPSTWAEPFASLPPFGIESLFVFLSLDASNSFNANTSFFDNWNTLTGYYPSIPKLKNWLKNDHPLSLNKESFAVSSGLFWGEFLLYNVSRKEWQLKEKLQKECHHFEQLWGEDWVEQFALSMAQMVLLKQNLSSLFKLKNYTRYYFNFDCANRFSKSPLGILFLEIHGDEKSQQLMHHFKLAMMKQLPQFMGFWTTSVLDSLMVTNTLYNSINNLDPLLQPFEILDLLSVNDWMELGKEAICHKNDLVVAYCVKYFSQQPSINSKDMQRLGEIHHQMKCFIPTKPNLLPFLNLHLSTIQAKHLLNSSLLPAKPAVSRKGPPTFRW